VSSFILHIIFSGLIAFIPTQDGKEMDVLLLNVADCHHLSNGTVLPQHKPLLFSRAGSCTGDCPTRDAQTAQIMFVDQSATTATDSLEAAVPGGGVWQLDGSDLSLNKGSADAADLPPLSIVTGVRQIVDGQPAPIPTTSGERADFDWVMSLSKICPDCTLRTDLLDSQPPSIVAARFHLRSGNLFTYRVARIGSSVTPVHFQPLVGDGTVSTYSQAIATYVGADIEVTGDSIDIAESKFNGDPGRTMHLTPDTNGTISVAVLNLPPFGPPPAVKNAWPAAGAHGEAYYDLATNAPAAGARLVPFPGAAPGVGTYPDVDWSSIHPQSDLFNDLLNALRLDIGRTAYDSSLCPPIKP